MKDTFAQLDYLIINSKWKNSVNNFRAYNYFNNIASYHRIVKENIQLTLRSNINKNKVKSINYRLVFNKSWYKSIQNIYTNEVTKNYNKVSSSNKNIQ